MDDRHLALWAAVARKALRDVREDYHHPRRMDAQQWLMLAGLMQPDGTLPYGLPKQCPNYAKVHPTSAAEYSLQRRLVRKEKV